MALPTVGFRVSLLRLPSQFPLIICFSDLLALIPSPFLFVLVGVWLFKSHFSEVQDRRKISGI